MKIINENMNICDLSTGTGGTLLYLHEHLMKKTSIAKKLHYHFNDVD